MSPVASAKHVLGLPVDTRGGNRLGKVIDFEFDVDGHQIETYLVRPSRLVHPLTNAALRVHRRQVIAITDQHMVVEDMAGESRVSKMVRPLAKDVATAVSTRGA